MLLQEMNGRVLGMICKLKFYLCKRDDNFQFVELHSKCRVVTIRKKLIKLHIKLTKD